jgi:hypothetical protein
VYPVTSDRVLFQCDAVSGEDRGLGREHAGRWAPCNSLFADEFSNWVEIVFEHEHLLLNRGLGSWNWTVGYHSLVTARSDHVNIHSHESQNGSDE